LLEFGEYVFGDENDASGASNQSVFAGFGRGSDEAENGAAIGWGNSDPAAAAGEAGVEREVEAELIDVEAKGEFLIVDEDGDGVDAKVGACGWRWNGHVEDYRRI
jgi:hypothetical protein